MLNVIGKYNVLLLVKDLNKTKKDKYYQSQKKDHYTNRISLSIIQPQLQIIYQNQKSHSQALYNEDKLNHDYG